MCGSQWSERRRAQNSRLRFSEPFQSEPEARNACGPDHHVLGLVGVAELSPFIVPIQKEEVAARRQFAIEVRRGMPPETSINRGEIVIAPASDRVDGNYHV